MFLVPPLPQNRTLAPGRLGEDEMANNDKGQRLATGHCMHGGDLVFYTALGILQTQEDRVGWGPGFSMLLIETLAKEPSS